MRALVALDLSSQPDDVLSKAALWAQRMGAVLDLLFVDATPAVAAYITDPTLTAILVREESRLRERHQERLTQLLDTIPTLHRGIARSATGNAAEVVCSTAESYDLLIVATHGRRGFAHLWLGSVAEKIVRASSIPVLVLHLGA